MPAGDEGLIDPAGLMWSVVTESPKIASARAWVTSFGSPGVAGKGVKYGSHCFSFPKQRKAELRMIPRGSKPTRSKRALTSSE